MTITSSTQPTQLHQLQIREQISNIEAGIERLDSVITDLESRLQDVLGPINQKDSEPEKAPVLVPLAAILSNFQHQIEILGSKIVDITSRLEL